MSDSIPEAKNDNKEPVELNQVNIEIPNKEGKKIYTVTVEEAVSTNGGKNRKSKKGGRKSKKAKKSLKKRTRKYRRG